MLLNSKDIDTETLLYSLIIAVIFIIIIMPVLQNCKSKDKKQLKENLENIFSGEPKFLFSNKCARSCCINSGWPYPPELLEKDISAEELKKYIQVIQLLNFQKGCRFIRHPFFYCLTCK